MLSFYYKRRKQNVQNLIHLTTGNDQKVLFLYKKNINKNYHIFTRCTVTFIICIFSGIIHQHLQHQGPLLVLH